MTTARALEPPTATAAQRSADQRPHPQHGAGPAASSPAIAAWIIGLLFVIPV